MQITHVSLEELKRSILAVLTKHLGDLSVYRIFFFGSRVTGTGSDHSDIDIGIEGPASISLSVLSKIQEDFDALPFLYSLEIVDFSSVSADFRAVALQNIHSFSR